MSMRIAPVAVAVGIVGATAAVAPTRAGAEPQLPRAGGLGRGLTFDPFEIGATQAFGPGGTAYGVRAAVGFQLDIDARWAFRMPIVFGGAISGDHAGYGELDVVPGVVYRFRDDADQPWVPYVGGGMKIGAWGAHLAMLDRPLVEPPAAAALLDWDWDEHHGDGDGDPNIVTSAGAGVELWAGAEWRPNRWFALTPELTYSRVRVDGVSVQALSESVTIRFTL